MSKLNIQRTRDLLQKFDFRAVFIEELGWSHASSRKPLPWQKNDAQGARVMIAQLAGVAVFEVTTADGKIPDAQICRALADEISKQHYENLLIFTDARRIQSLWYYVKREDGKAHPREHWYFKGQPGDLFLSKLSGMVVDLSEFDAEGAIEVTKVARKLKEALDVERVTKKFFGEFAEHHIEFLKLISGISNEHDRRWYASALLNRLMFTYFLQRKGFIDGGDQKYLQNKLAASHTHKPDNYYRDFLRLLFFEGFAKPVDKRSEEAKAMLGEIKYLNGGLFLEHRIEIENPDIRIPDRAFENLFGLFERYSWNLNDTPGDDDDEIRPEVLGYIFEKYINQKAFGAYYTRIEITDYLCEQTIHKLILARVNAMAMPPGPAPRPGALFPREDTGLFVEREYDSMSDLLMNLNGRLCRWLMKEVLPEITLLDPACGSGAFLVAAMKTLINIYSAVIGRIEFSGDQHLKRELEKLRAEHHGSLDYFIKKRIITDNLYGVDIMEEATEIAKLRLFLALVASAQNVEQLEPLPNIDFNILAGNSLIGLMHINDEDFNQRHAQGHLFVKSYHEILGEKNRMIKSYRHATSYADDLQGLRKQIEDSKQEASETLGDILLNEFQTKLKIKYEQATWDEKKGQEGKPVKRTLTMDDIKALRPFHWGYEFDEIINKRGGFDAIITNPPWETFKPQAKEFFSEYSELVTKNKMTIKEFEKEQAKLLKQKDVREAWLEYQSRFPHVSLYYRGTSQYKNQIAIVNGKKAGTDINLYKLFIEQCFNLLRKGGRCGIIIPTGIYSDLGTKQLREILFSECMVDALMALSNERFIFEGLDHRFKFCLLAFEKGGKTESFKAAFRFDPREAIRPEGLTNFFGNKSDHVTISVPLIRKLSPDATSVMEFKREIDIRLAENMLRFPLLGEKIEGKWILTLTREFDMTNDSHLFKTSPGKRRLPLWEGKMIHQFTHQWAEPRYWLDEDAAAGELREARRRESEKVARRHGLHLDEDEELFLDYKFYRVAFRDVASSTNERTMIMTILPPNRFCPHTMSLEQAHTTRVVDGKLDPNFQTMYHPARLFLCAVMNSFIVDFWLRRSVTNHLSFFFVQGVPVPRLTAQDAAFTPIVTRAAKLICTTSEFDDLAREIGLGDHSSGVTDEAERATLRAELDGMVAHLYGLTEKEFAYLLTTFPQVPDSVKEAALAAYRDFAPDPDDQALAAQIAQGESARLEFKAAARWNPFKLAKDDTLKENIVQGVAAFLNSREGGALLIGVNSDGVVIGIEDDYRAANPQKPGHDSYELFLRNLLSDGLGGEHGHSYHIGFHHVNGRELCRIAVDPAPKPVYVKGEMYVRAGNQKRKLTAQEAVAYQRQRWP